MKRKIALLFVTVLLLSTFGSPAQAQEAPGTQAEDLQYYFRRSWGGEGEYLGNPWSIAIADDGLIYVTDLRLSRITEITPGLNIYRSIGDYDLFDPAKFTDPKGLAFSPDGTLFVVDAWQNQVKHITRGGELINYWGVGGGNPGEFEGPSGIAISNTGKIYIADTVNNRIQVFDTDGNYLDSWGGTGNELGKFIYPIGVAIDSYGSVYVIDEHNHRVQKFSEYGVFLSAWGERGSGELQFDRTTGITVGSSDLVYVLDSGNAMIKVFYPDGGFKLAIPLDNTFEFPEYHFSKLASDNAGNLYYTISQPNSLVKISAAGVVLYEWNMGSRPGGKFDYLHGIGFNSKGNLFVADRFNDRIQAFSYDGGYLFSIQDVEKPIHLAFDSQDNIFVTCSGDSKVKKFDKDGSFVREWGGVGSGEGLFNTPWAIAVDNNGYVFVSDYYNDNIQKFTSDGLFVSMWGSSGSLPGQFNTIEDMYFSEGTLYVVDGNNSRVQLFNSDGEWQKTWNNNLFHPYAISKSPAGAFFVANYSDVTVYDSQGNYLSTLFRSGSEPGQVHRLTGIEFSQAGDLYLADSNNERIQMFTHTMPEPDVYTGLVQNGSFDHPGGLQEWSYHGTIANNPVTLSDVAFQGNHSVRIGVPVLQAEQGITQAVTSSTFYIDPDMNRPLLTFSYRLYVNDIIHYSDFLVEIQTGDGRSNLAVVLHDGYQPCTGNYAPKAGRDLGWRTATYDLSAYKGEHIRVVFSNRNLWPDSLGIWTNVDDVRVLDAGPLPPLSGPYKQHLPLAKNGGCDMPDYNLQGGIERPMVDY